MICVNSITLPSPGAAYRCSQVLRSMVTLSYCTFPGKSPSEEIRKRGKSTGALSVYEIAFSSRIQSFLGEVIALACRLIPCAKGDWRGRILAGAALRKKKERKRLSDHWLIQCLVGCFFFLFSFCGVLCYWPFTIAIFTNISSDFLSLV